MSGNYAETITVVGLQRNTGNDQRTFKASGNFSLTRITDVPTLNGAAGVASQPIQPIYN